jgi:hypothetical protein
MQRRLFAFALGSGLALASSCANLPDIPSGQCGNHLVEPGEDCDLPASSSAGGLVCRAPGTAGQCHYDCTKDSVGGGPSCPAGAGCGSDAICRAASGTFAAPSSATFDTTTDAVAIADFDGDGFKDVFTRSDNVMRVQFADTAGTLGDALTIPSSHTSFAIGTLTDAPGASLAFVYNGFLTTWRDNGAKSLLPKEFPTVDVAPDRVILLASDVDPTQPGTELFVIVSDIQTSSGRTGPIVAHIGGDGTPSKVISLPRIPADIAGDPITANIIETGSPCDDFAFAFKGDPGVYVISPCTSTGIAMPMGKPTPAITFDPGIVVSEGMENGGSLRVGDIDGDGHLDILVETTKASGDPGLHTLVAYGLGDGTFNSTPPTINTVADNKALAPDPIVTDVLPLAVGQLTADKFVDVVRAADNSQHSFIELHTVMDPTAKVSITAASRFNEAAILDFNADGFADVVASGPTGIDVFAGRGSALFVHQSYPTSRGANRLAFSDFDGDATLDVAFRLSTALPNSTDPDEVSVLFGRRLFVPEGPPVAVGLLDQITQLVAAPFGALGNGLGGDAVGDLAVLAKSSLGNATSTKNDGGTTTEQFVSLLTGSTTRVMQSPLGLGSPRMGNSATARAVGIGRFGPGGHAAMAAVGTTIDPKTGNVAASLWLIPVTGDVDVDLTTVTSTSFLTDQSDAAKMALPTFDWSRARVGAVDLNPPASGTGTDEAIITLPPLGELENLGTLYVASSEGEGVFSIAQTIPIPNQDANLPLDLVTADFNGDGKVDVAVLRSIVGAMDNSAAPATKAYVFWNDKNGKLDTTPTEVALPNNGPIFGIAAANMDSDPVTELVLLTGNGVHVAKSQALGTLFDVSGPVTYTDATHASHPIPGGARIAGGDVTGDGVDDLVIQSAGKLELFPGISTSEAR